MIKLNKISELKIDTYRTGRMEINGIIAEGDKNHEIDRTYKFVCFGYKGNNFALNTWAEKESRGLHRNTAIPNKRLLWNTHNLYRKIQIENNKDHVHTKYRERFLSELGDENWFFLVKLAHKYLKKNGNINIIYLSKHDYPSAKIYYDYCCWLKQNI